MSSQQCISNGIQMGGQSNVAGQVVTSNYINRILCMLLIFLFFFIFLTFITKFGKQAVAAGMNTTVINNNNHKAGSALTAQIKPIVNIKVTLLVYLYFK